MARYTVRELRANASGERAEVTQSSRPTANHCINRLDDTPFAVVHVEQILRSHFPPKDQAARRYEAADSAECRSVRPGVVAQLDDVIHVDTGDEGNQPAIDLRS